MKSSRKRKFKLGRIRTISPDRAWIRDYSGSARRPFMTSIGISNALRDVYGPLIKNMDFSNPITDLIPKYVGFEGKNIPIPMTYFEEST